MMFHSKVTKLMYVLVCNVKQLADLLCLIIFFAYFGVSGTHVVPINHRVHMFYLTFNKRLDIRVMSSSSPLYIGKVQFL